MKQTRYIFLLPIVALMAAGSLVGCAKEEPNPNNPDRMKIAPLVALNTSGVEAGSSYGSTAQTKATVSGSEVLDLYVVRADQTSASAYGAYDATTITATRAAGTGQQSLTLNPVQYYRADGLKTKLTGWYPAGTYNGTSHTVSWTIDGQQDVMTAPKQEGSWTSAMPTMTFEHRLTQLQFYPYAETQSAVDAWGKITGIEVLNQQNTVAYALTDDATGTVSFSGAATNSFSAGIAAGGASLSLSTTANKVTNAKQMGNPVMIVPQSAASHTLTLRIILADNTYKNVTLTGALTAGTPYRVYMKFTERDITIETTVTQWNNVTTSDNMGNVRIGDYLEGGIVYWVDPNDVGNYKVVSLEEASTTLKWAAVNTYVVSSARNDADGKANSKAIRDYFEANPSTVGTDFAVAFPAASYCYNYAGKGGTDAQGTWYLPAKSELQYLWCAFNGKAPISWDSSTNASATADATAKAFFNKHLTDAGGTSIISHAFWSSTELSSNPSRAWYVGFSNGGTSDGTKVTGSYVRCVKHIVPPPAVGNYYYSDGSYSAALETGKTVAGVIYYVDAADPTKFKVVSLKDDSGWLVWAADVTYVVNGARSDADGKANSDAIKAYYDTEHAAGRITTTFETAFPAASYCYNYAGKDGTDSKGTWYLPAKSELQYLWCAFNGKAPISWDSNTNASVPNNADAQKVFNKYLTDAGGGGITDSPFCSSTEDSSNTSFVWYVDFYEDGSTTTDRKDDYGYYGAYYVRCVRDI